MSGTVGVVHIAAQPVHIGCHLRQRCAWCGTMLEDYNMHEVSYESSDPDQRPPTWETGGLVLVDGNTMYSVPHVAGEDVPANACAGLDPAVTA
jgi:hypothetical protein